MIKQITLGVVLPALLAACALALSWWSARLRSRPMLVPRERGAWGGAIGFGACFAASFVAEDGWPAFPPAERWQWIAVLAVAAAALGVVASFLPKTKVARVAMAVLLGGAAAALLRLPTMDTPGARIAIGGAACGTLLALEPLAARRPGPSLPLTLAIVFSTVSVVALQTHFAKLAVMSGAMGAASGAAFALALVHPRLSLAQGGTLVVAALVPVLLLTSRAYDYQDVPRLAIAMPLFALFTPWIAEAPALTPRSPRLAALLRVAVVVIPCAVAVWMALGVGSADSGYTDSLGYP